MDYNGLWAPITEWTDASSGPVEGVQNDTSPGNVLYIYTITASRDDEGLSLNCTLKFEAPPIGAIPPNRPGYFYSVDAPDYTDSCQFQPLSVHCKY